MGAVLAAVALGLPASAAPAAAQELAPRLPHGSGAVVLPVQSSLPSAAGTWPGRAADEAEALRAMDAELAFALAERRGAEEWAMPDDLRRSVRRNPVLKVDPDRVAFQALLSEPDRREQLSEPLHGELRALAALHGTRFVVLPLVLRMAPVAASAGSPGTRGEGEPECADGVPLQRPELLLALIDIRRSSVLWHGTVQGSAACPDDGGALARLAATVALQLTES